MSVEQDELSSCLAFDVDSSSLWKFGKEIQLSSEKHESPLLGRFSLSETEAFHQECILALPSSFDGVDTRRPFQSIAKTMID
jgi:hypothetical protein